MKKILLLGMFLLGGCSFYENNPTKEVEDFLAKYQTLDEEVLKDLNESANQAGTFNEKQKDEYLTIMKKHYQHLRYEIKDETIDGDNALVKVEIEVDDYSKILNEVDEYQTKHEEEFKDDLGNYSETKYMDYRLKAMKNVKETVKYTLELSLTKNKDGWKLKKLTPADEQKINGIYNH